MTVADILDRISQDLFAASARVSQADGDSPDTIFSDALHSVAAFWLSVSFQAPEWAAAVRTAVLAEHAANGDGDQPDDLRDMIATLTTHYPVTVAGAVR